MLDIQIRDVYSHLILDSINCPDATLGVFVNYARSIQKSLLEDKDTLTYILVLDEDIQTLKDIPF